MPRRGIPGVFGDLLAAGHRDGDLGIRRNAVRRRDLGQRLAHHLARHRVDRRLADRQAAAPAVVTVPTPSPARKTMPLPGRQPAHLADDQGA